MTDISYVDRWKNYPGDSIPEHRIVMSIKRSVKFEDLVDITYYSVLEPIPTSSYTTHFFRFLPVKFSEYPPAPDERYWKDRNNQTPSLFDDIENEYLPEERWFGYPEFKPQPDQICIFRYINLSTYQKALRLEAKFDERKRQISFCASSLAKWKDEKKVMLLKMDEYQKDVQMSLPFDSILIEVPH